jgi:hypothetical protein
VRVPQPHICFEGVLLMDLVTDADGNVAPRLNDVALSEELALEYHALLRQSGGAHAVRRDHSRRPFRIQHPRWPKTARSSSTCRKPSTPRRTACPPKCWNAT